MLTLIFTLSATFIAIYINMWFLLLILENKSKLFEKKLLKKLPTVSILIPAHNEEKNIGSTLDSVLSLDYPKGKCEVIVIDNGSTDRTSKIVKKFKSVKLIKIPNPGKSLALNKGLKLAKGEIVGILDADTIVSKDGLKKTVGFFGDPKVGIVGNHIKVDSEKGAFGYIQNIEYLFSAITKKLISFMNSLYVAPGTLSLMRRDIAKEIGFSDDTVAEDMDIALSISKKGYKIVNSLDSFAFTKIPKNIKDLTKQRIRWYRGFIENLVKHSDVLSNKKFLNLSYFLITGLIAIFIGIIFSSMLFFDIFRNSYIFTRTTTYMPVIDQFNLFLDDLPKIANRLLYPYFFICSIFIFTTSFAILTFSLKSLKNINTKNIIILPIYMLCYYTLIMIFWFLALVLELIRWKKRW
jgi:cellulose synthase/poly-beta-1,6-N-acetylglucosamine synthase-like glycosyltransferase